MVKTEGFLFCLINTDNSEKLLVFEFLEGTEY